MILALLFLLLAPPALAVNPPPWDTEFGHVVDCYTYNSLETVYDDLAMDAQATNTRVFGALGVLENQILPELVRERGPIFLGRYDNRAIWGAVDVPGLLIGKCKDTVGSIPLDVTAYSLALGARPTKWLTLYYSGATTTTWGIMDPAWRALSTSIFGTTMNAFYTVGAPLIGSGSYARDANTYHIDYVAGMQLNARDLVVGRVGYIGSQGLYASGQIKWAFVNSALTDQFSSLSYLQAGLDRFDLWPEDLGKSKLAMRKLRFNVGPDGPSANRAIEERSTEDQTGFKDLWTGQLRQYEIAERFDVDISSRMKPFSFHHFIVGAHSPFYYTPEERDGEVSWNVQTGLYYANAQYYYGVRPGLRYYLEAEFVGHMDDTSAIELSLRFNDPDTLDLFPTAVNSVEFFWAIQFGAE